MFSCDYNGWADVPEDEREAIEAFESAQRTLSATVPVLLVIRPSVLPTRRIPERRAA